MSEIERLNVERDGFYMAYRMKCDEETKAQAMEIERLREALKLALNSHGRMLMSDPPQDPWKVNRVDEVIRELLQEVPKNEQ
jgi:hypothetical protein